MFESYDRVRYMRELRKDRRGLRSKISPLLPREDYKTSHVFQLSDMRECGKVSKPRKSRHARFWVASSGFCKFYIQKCFHTPDRYYKTNRNGEKISIAGYEVFSRLELDFSLITYANFWLFHFSSK